MVQLRKILVNVFRLIIRSMVYLLIFFYGIIMFVVSKNSGSPDAISLGQNVGVNIAASGLLLLILYWWQLDNSGDVQKKLEEQQARNQVLEAKLDKAISSLEQIVASTQQKELPQQANVSWNLEKGSILNNRSNVYHINIDCSNLYLVDPDPNQHRIP
ncbi:MAG: hypothetical protein K8L97_22310 [Anaerolineae bacterium]|nr:hypothetical protein [Anaerolineae bacterium]